MRCSCWCSCWRWARWWARYFGPGGAGGVLRVGGGGALVYALLLDTPQPLIGGFPAVYGLIGAFTFLLWVRLALNGGPQARAFTLIGFLMGIQLVFGLLFGGGKDWIADLAGFVAGFGLSFRGQSGGLEPGDGPVAAALIARAGWGLSAPVLRTPPGIFLNRRRSQRRRVRRRSVMRNAPKSWAAVK